MSPVEGTDEVLGAWSVGLWSGLVSSFLVASLGMVQVRSKIFGGFPSGDWPKDGYTWHFLPVFLGCLVLWAFGAWLWSNREAASWQAGLQALGRAAAPLLGLVTAWSWYGLTGDQFHAAHGCDIYVLCHDVGRAPIVVWSAPWLIWAGIRVGKLWKHRGRERDG